MKAAVCYNFGEPLVVEDIHLDPPQADEVRVHIKACAICHSDIHWVEGAWGGSLPAVAGHEASGVVTEVGSNVTSVATGQRVIVTLLRSCGTCHTCTQGALYACEGDFALLHESRLRTHDGTAITQAIATGAFAEEVVVHVSQVAALPEDIPFDCAALLSCGVVTGLGAVTNTAQVPAGSSVVVIGTGGVGLNSVQGAHLVGAHPIIAVDIHDEKLATAKQFGATHGINPTKEDARNLIKDITQGRGADYVFVTVGSTAAVESGMGYVAVEGMLVIVGMPPTGATASIKPVNIAFQSQRIVGSRMGSTRLSNDAPRLMALYLAGKLKLDELISNRYPLTEINQAIAEVKQGQVLRNIITF